MVIGTLGIKLTIREAQTLKDKRRIIKSIIGRLQNNFNISIAEVGGNDLKQQALLGVAVVGNDGRLINAVMADIMSFIRAFPSVEVTSCEQELL